MRRAAVIFDAATPIAIRAGRDQESAPSLAYLPGTTLRGALAAAHALLRPADTDQRFRDQFTTLFVGNAVRIGNGYPTTFDKNHPLDDDALPVRTLPHTALSCKRCDGFLSPLPPDPRRPRHGVRDGLIRWALFTIAGQERLSLLDQVQTCGYSGDGLTPCTAPLERFAPDAEVYRRGDGPIYGSPSVTYELRTRTGISRARGAAHETVLYSRQMLVRGTRLQAIVEGPDASLTTLDGFLRDASECGMLRVGNNRTRGLGGLEYVESIDLERSENVVADLAARLETFDAALRQAAAAAAVDLPREHARYLPVTLDSDVIAHDALFRGRGRLDGGWLMQETGIADAAFVFQAAGLRHVTGWNALWALPRADEWAIARGSVFLLALPRPPSDADVGRLQQLEADGTGRRRGEGFGRIRFADPFHTEVQSR